MSSGESAGDLEARVLRGTRALGREASLFSAAIAERVGLALTDVECLDLLADAGRVTAGALSELAGLTSGATTRMIDRLEQAGYVRRFADPADRRRVLVEAVPERMQTLAALHQSILQAQLAVIGRFGDESLDAIADYLERSIAVTKVEAKRLREPESEESTSGGGSYAAPLAGNASGRLVFLSGAPNVALRGDAAMAELYRARFEGPVPRVRVRGGVVTVSYPRFGWFDWRARLGDVNLDASVHWRRDRGEIALNAGVRWAIELRGGVSRLSADLRTIDLEAFELRGGAGRIELILGKPVGIVPLRVNGGLSHLGVHRPAGTAVGFTLRGGASGVVLDGERYKGMGSMSVQSPGAGEAANRFDIEITGGANKITIGSR